MTQTHPVVIAGAGPNGLMLAAELQLAGIPTLILERRTQPDLAPKANGIVGQVVELLDHRGLYHTLTGDPNPPKPIPGFMFGGLPLILADLPNNPMRTLPIPQHKLETTLQNHATNLGTQIRRGHEITNLTQNPDHVTIEINSPTGTYHIQTQYLIGCDGAHSIVRKQAGIPFPGVTTTNIVSRTAHVIIDPTHLTTTPGGPTGTMDVLHLPDTPPIPAFRYHRTETGAFVFASFTPGIHLVTTFEWDGDTIDDNAPMTIDELRTSTHRVLGTTIPMHAPDQPGNHALRRLAGRNTRQAQHYRNGRILIAGDAAHVHTAIGGPGLNLGLADATNLAWKLAAHLHGWAPPGLLDTYETERHPVGQRVVMHTQAQQALLAPGSDVTALRELLTELLHNPDNRSHIINLMTGAETRYHTGPASHPLTGLWAPNLALTINGQPTRLAQLMHRARPVLLQLNPTSTDLPAIAAGWQDRIDHHVVDEPVAGAPATALLIRPDGHVAWASDEVELSEGSAGDLRTALATWFGPARQPALS